MYCKENCKEYNDAWEIIEMQNELLDSYKDQYKKMHRVEDKNKELKNEIKRLERLLKRANKRWVEGKKVNEIIKKEMYKKGQI